MTAEQDITLYAKRDNTLDITIITNAGNPVDLTQYKLQLTIKALLTDTDADALYQGAPSLTNRIFGKFCFLVPLATTSNAAWAEATAGIYDVSTITPSGKESTLIAGNCTIVQPVAQTLANAG
jgi:hypothetical protein